MTGITKGLGNEGKIVTIVAIACLALALSVLGIGCPIKFVTGVSCPGCGMTRAWLSALSLRFDEALSYHPLYWLLIPALFLGLEYNRLPRRLANVLAIVMICALLITWFVRLALPDEWELAHGITVGETVGIDTPVWLKAIFGKC